MQPPVHLSSLRNSAAMRRILPPSSHARLNSSFIIKLNMFVHETYFSISPAFCMLDFTTVPMTSIVSYRNGHIRYNHTEDFTMNACLTFSMVDLVLQKGHRPIYPNAPLIARPLLATPVHVGYVIDVCFQFQCEHRGKKWIMNVNCVGICNKLFRP